MDNFISTTYERTNLKDNSNLEQLRKHKTKVVICASTLDILNKSNINSIGFEVKERVYIDKGKMLFERFFMCEHDIRIKLDSIEDMKVLEPKLKEVFPAVISDDYDIKGSYDSGEYKLELIIS